MITKQFVFGAQETIREWFLRLLFYNYVVTFTLGTPNFRHFRHFIQYNFPCQVFRFSISFSMAMLI